jgi:hypothetical protein
MAVNTLLLRCFTRREHSADEHAEVVMSVLFYGLLTREIT